jgi:hypothetical protein
MHACAFASMCLSVCIHMVVCKFVCVIASVCVCVLSICPNSHCIFFFDFDHISRMHTYSSEALFNLQGGTCMTLSTNVEFVCVIVSVCVCILSICPNSHCIFFFDFDHISRMRTYSSEALFNLQGGTCMTLSANVDNELQI